MSDSDIRTTHDLSVQTDTTSNSASSPLNVAKVIRLDEPSRPRLGKDFLRLWGATAASNVGDGVRITALPLLAAFLTRNPVLISGVLIATRLPWLLFSLHAGAIVDRVDRRRLVVGVNIARGVVMGVLALSVAAGIGGLAALYLVALLQGIGEVFSDNTSFAMLPSVVPKERLEDANGALEGAIIVTNEFAGPALGALQFAHWASVPFALDAATFVLAAWLFAGIRVTSPPREKSSTTVGEDIRTGLDWLRSHTLLRNLTVIASLTNLALQATFAIQVLFVLNTLGLSATGFGLVMAAEAGGSLIGSFAAAPMKRRLGTRATVVIALSVVAVANLVVATTGSWVLAGAMWISMTFAGAVWTIVTNSLRQSIVPDGLLGRVQSAHRLFSWGAMPLGALIGGVTAATFGLRAPFFLAGGILCILTVAAATLLRREAPVTIRL